MTEETAAPAPRSPALFAEALHVSLGRLEVLRGVSLSVSPGTVLAVLGPSGAGKTTLFRTLAGELLPSRGRVHLGSADVTREPLWRRARRGLGYVPQGPSVLWDLTVADNIRSFERAARVETLPLAERASTVDLEGRLAVRASELSGGERRRLELLRALLAAPRVLVCDEPFSGGDPAHVRSLASLLRGYAARGAAVVLADHRVGDALSTCDEALLLADGQVAAAGPAASFADHPAVRRRYLEAP